MLRRVSHRVRPRRVCDRFLDGQRIECRQTVVDARRAVAQAVPQARTQQLLQLTFPGHEVDGSTAVDGGIHRLRQLAQSGRFGTRIAGDELFGDPGERSMMGDVQVLADARLEFSTPRMRVGFARQAACTQPDPHRFRHHQGDAGPYPP